MKLSAFKQRTKKPRKVGAVEMLYDEARLDKPVRRGLNWIMAGNMFGTLHGIICGGGTAAMVGLAAALGAGDMEFGLLVAIPQVAALMQIPFSILVNKTRKRKIYLLTIGLFSRFLWMFFGLLPLLGGLDAGQMKLYALIALLGISSVCGAVINVCWFPWFSDLAPLRIRGRWFSIRESYLAIGSLLFSLVVAFLLDYLPIDSRYVIIFLIGGLLGVLDMVCFGFAPEVKPAAREQMHLGKEFKQILQNKPFMRLTVMWMVWCFTANLSGAYLTPYVLPTLLHNLVGATFWSGCNLAANNMQLSTSPDENRPTYIAVFSCITALLGTALGTMCGGWLLEFCNAAGWFAGKFDRYMALILLSCVLRFGFTLLLVPGMHQDGEGTAKDVICAMLPKRRVRY